MWEDLIKEILFVLISVGVSFLIAYLKKRLGTEKMKQIEAELVNKQQLARTAVLFAEQFYKDLDGVDKYIHASEWLSKQLADHGINVSDESIRSLTEAALKELKLEFGKSWNEATK